MRFGLLAGFLFVTLHCGVSCGDDSAASPPPSYRPQDEMRSGGVIEESYVYHRQGPMSAASKASAPLPSPKERGGMSGAPGGWYGYGFPVRTFRWGWFGAQHYYPTVWWHDGYYGECCRYAYRRGY
jgi:hypothetical protein